jgi:UDP-glucose 4-epimerase
MNILITGALGHIGSYLLDSGIFKNHHVTAVDNMMTQRYCSLFNLSHRPQTFLEMDFSDIPDDIIKQSDVIIHLAAITNAADSFKNASQIEETNVKKTKELIDRCGLLCNETALFLFPSSTSVYGKASEDVMEDDPSFLNPQSPYAKSKIEIENYLKESSKIDYRIARFGTIFGVSKGMRFHTAINKFCYQACFGLPITVWKENYEQHRPYLGLRDAASAIQLLINPLYDSKTGIYNVITENIKLRDIVVFLRSKLEIKIDFVDTPLLNQFPYKVNFSKIFELGYAPQDNIEQGISETIAILT